MNLLKQCQFYGVRLRQLADASGFTQSYVRQVLIGERTNSKIYSTTLLALHNRKEELLTALLKESA
jgi:transcriptional regulator with XRE-family HTH domain